MKCTSVKLREFQLRLINMDLQWKKSFSQNPESRYQEGISETYEEVRELFEDVFETELNEGRTVAPEDCE